MFCLKLTSTTRVFSFKGGVMLVLKSSSAFAIWATLSNTNQVSPSTMSS